MPLLHYSMSLDALVILDMVEDPTLSVPMKLTSDGILYVKGQFIEETRSYYYPPPIENEFDYWLDGAPVMETGEDGKFSDWIDDSPFEDL